MSELIQKSENRSFRWRLLTGASALTLMSYVASMSTVLAGDDDRPTVWIELGGQLSRWETSQEIYAPSFVASTPSEFLPPQKSVRPPRYGIDESAALVFQPKDSDWTVSVSVRYGRASSTKHVRQQSNPTYYTVYSEFHRSSYGVYRHHTNTQKVRPIAARFADAMAKQGESHAIVDFQAGKDFGIGVFGRGALSTLDVGVRFAQFTSKSAITLRENPDWKFEPYFATFSTAYDRNGYFYSVYRKAKGAAQAYHSFDGTFRADRSFSGIGPSISWKSSEQLAGSSERGSLTVDWGVNAAVLFGRQKAKTHHQTIERYSPGGPIGALRTTVYDFNHPSALRSHSVIVPNIGGFAGLSYKYPNAKVSFGYRADFFFGAMDGGIDARRTSDVGFHGPFATLSIGLGG